MSRPMFTANHAVNTTGSEAAESNKDSPGDTDFEDSSEDEWWNDAFVAAHQQPEATTQNRVTQWPSAEASRQRPVDKNSSIDIRRSAMRRNSVQRPVREPTKHRQRLQNAKAGIKVITNFSRLQGPVPATQAQATHDHTMLVNGQMGRIAKNRDSEAKRARSQDARGRVQCLGFANTEAGERGEPACDSGDCVSAGMSREGDGTVRRPPPAAIKLENDLSPSDRPIVIGLSIPSAKPAQFRGSPHTVYSQAGELCVPSDGSELPETPTIIITPAQTSTAWEPIGVQFRGVSSVYSRGTNGSIRHKSIVPERSHVADEDRRAQHSYRESIGTLFDEDETPSTPKGAKSRVMSTGTIFEEDSTPILSKFTTLSPTDIKHTSISPLEHRASKGWWTLITTPFLTRSNTLASPKSAKFVEPPVPNIEEITATAARDNRQREKSTLSPLTPETTTTISSDAWWEKRDTINGMPKLDDEAPTDYLTHDSQSGTLPFMLVPSQSVSNRHQRGPEHNVALPAQSDTQTAPIMVPANDFQVRSHGKTRHIASLGSTNSPDHPVSTHNQARQPTSRVIVDQATAQTLTRDQVPAAFARAITPPPYSPPRRAYIPRHRAVLPGDHAMRNVNPQEPPSPGPLSPEDMRPMGTRNNHHQLSDLPLARTARRIGDNDLEYAPGPRQAVATTFDPPPKKAVSQRRAERKRQRYEKEENLAKKAGGLWRGRGCIPQRGCYPRAGPEGRKRRSIWFGLVAGLLTLIILIVVLATQLHHRSPASQPSQWLNLTGFPPIYTGLSTVAGPENPVAASVCVFPSTLWSCSLPKELRQAGMPPSAPNFRLLIQWDNSTTANETFANVTGNSGLSLKRDAINAVSANAIIKRALHTIRGVPTFSPSPAPPSFAEQYFLGNTTDNIVSAEKSGEPTPFYITFLSTTSGSNSTPAILRRSASNSTEFPNTTSIIPAPDTNPDGTAAAANLLPLPVQQPLRLYDRSLPTEHYGFYTYFNRSIFLQSASLLNSSEITNSTSDANVSDQNGGSTASTAKYRCTWTQTRYLTQIWTRSNGTKALLNAAEQVNYLSSASNITAAIANDFTQPGSHPYPVTITTDRHGGDPTQKMIYCYELQDDGSEMYIEDSAKQYPEFRENGGNGVVINPAPGLFTAGGDASLGGFDGGNTGCACQWTNWRALI